jgi:hypothetical protein
MTTENDRSEVRVSNWTLATGTRAGERHVYPSVRQDIQRERQDEPAERNRETSTQSIDRPH